MKVINGKLCLVGGYNKSFSMVNLSMKLIIVTSNQYCFFRLKGRTRSSVSFRKVFTTHASLIGLWSGLLRSFSPGHSALILWLKDSGSSFFLGWTTHSYWMSFQSASREIHSPISARGSVLQITRISNQTLPKNTRTWTPWRSSLQTTCLTLNKVIHLPQHRVTTF